MKRILAFDCGGTATRAGLYDSERRLLAEASGGASNPAEVGVEACIAVMSGLGRKLLDKGGAMEVGTGGAAGDGGTFQGGSADKTTIAAGLTVAAGVAGADVPEVRDRIAEGICTAFSADFAVVSDDRWPLLAANAGEGTGVVVLSGTGSGVLAKAARGEPITVGGRGSVLGDEGSAFQLGLRALRACSRAIDGAGPDTTLVQEMLCATGFKNYWELGRWSLSAGKEEIARLASAVTEQAGAGDAVACRCVEKEAAALAHQTTTAFSRLALPAKTPVFLHGGLIEKSALFRKAYEKALVDDTPGLRCRPADFRGHRAVLELALSPRPSHFLSTFEAAAGTNLSGIVEGGESGDPAGLPSTEERLAHGQHLDRLGALEMVRLMNSEDRLVAGAVAREETAIAAAVEAAAESLKNGGRILYVGSGTSGRLGVMDAAECLPTFGVSPDVVQGILSGGETAFSRSVEGAEDDGQQAAADLAALDPPLSGRDLVVGITASGTTPFVLAALKTAKESGARTVLLCCNPACRVEAVTVIAVSTGPEVLAGSTRLKAGTATKMVLNMISTGAMALSGRVYDGLMVGMLPLNAKLERRAAGIVAELAGVGREEAKDLLTEAGGSITVSILMARKGLDAVAAATLLERHGGSLRAALEEG